MDLQQILQKNPHTAPVVGLLERCRYWQKLDAALKDLLPPNLHDHFQVVCIEENALIVFASSQMAANRLKMLLPSLLPHFQQVDAQIMNIVCRVRPKAEAKVEKQLVLSKTALNAFAQSAEKLAHKPQLAAALRKLSKQDT